MPKGINNNLIPHDERSKNEARENGKKGGEKSGEVRRRRKTQKQILQQILDAPPNVLALGEEVYFFIQNLGISLEDIDSNEYLSMVMLYKSSLEDVKSREYLDKLIGRHPELKIKLAELKIRQEQWETEKRRETESAGNGDAVAIIDDLQ
ncbi:hypothetical protein AGMMS49975_24080 [Clostridia bacterium]|nr:hypothetical protein AGMMS49975_24080 [Clostridia bacterium]